MSESVTLHAVDGNARVVRIAGVPTAVGAAGVDLVLWELYPLYFGPGIVLGVTAPLAVATLGVAVVVLAYERGTPRQGVALVALNVAGAVLGIVWVWGTRPTIPT